MCGGGPPPGGTIASIAKYAPPDSAPVTRNRYRSPGPRNMAPLPAGRYSSFPAVVVAVTRVLLGVGGRRSSPPGAPVTSGNSLVSLLAQLVFLALPCLDAVLEL